MTLIKVPLLPSADAVWPFKCNRCGSALQLVRWVKSRKIGIRCSQCEVAQELPASTQDRVEQILKERES